ncbi:hypothetical protein DSM106972_090630 [Dulcicalothrix desertica PCC 7102]|uniref:Carrier domain-containing protein n=1 Tax=Dulcicalothrix desertica PCC 7102 TaxID=232991 RepID=A0A433UN61_9CYAN|nr:non-ribosomal peptide synthetase [Dulcicalothrix desertica]RUS95287.1 hypothetical protein DSM106972_090630 [Dulcicalothrix desertica PCC 7102]TWH43975.1 amino acid adenylation domain-containing protein [Dulcicalothrix desertica PCC 7102]
MTTDFNKRIAGLSLEKRKLLMQKLNKGKVLQTQIKPQNRDSSCFSLSFAQARLWFLNELEAESVTYNEFEAIEIVGLLRVDVLKQSLAEIVRRHEVLRTTFRVVDGRPVQEITCTSSVIPIVDLQALPEQEQSTVVQRLMVKEQSCPFDLTSGPLLRMTLLRLGEEKHLMLLTIHHIVWDRWSTGIFIQELSALYKAFSCGMPSPLPELSVQYADYAVWQQEWLSGEVLDTQLNYWKQQLADAPPLLELPTDRPRPSVQTFRGGAQQFQLNSDLTQKLKILSQQSEATLFMTLLAAFATLLFRYSGQKDIVMGSPIANRNYPEIEPLIGCFINSLVLRINIKENPSFLELLQQVRQVALDAYSHQDAPFEKLVEVLQPERNLSHHPLFQVMFILQNAPVGRMEMPDLTLTPLEVEDIAAKFDLSLSMMETQEGLQARWDYNSDLFDATTITRMAGYFQTLLESIVANPQQRISNLSLLKEAEQHQLLVEWNSTKTESPNEQCIHHLFEAQVERTPDAEAVVFADQKLTYQGLNSRANQLARYLQTLGVKPEVPVGVFVERSLEMAVGLLGVLKAGGAYIPYDPQLPKERLAYMLSDSQVPILLTQQKLVKELPDYQGRIVCLDTEWEAIATESQENLSSSVNPENLAYAIYTSGSTGQPKGVLITHQSLVHYALDIIKQFNLQQSDRFLQFAAIGFDVVVEEIFPTWLSGATVVLPESSEIISYADFLQLIEQQKLTVFELPTAYWNQWVYELSRLQKSPPACVRLVIIGGEKVSPERLADWQKFCIPLIHVYGLTETTVTSTLYHIAGGTEIQPVWSELPIGRPIANTQIYILDSNLQLTCVGVPGEVYIGGMGLGRGYLNRSDLTAERFIPNPFSNVTGERLYKTGDLARYLPCGNLQFLGRLDEQVKIRGFRIELGEIEAVLSQHPSVQQSIVLAREDVPGNKRLVAYIVPKKYPNNFHQTLRDNLKQKLPEYMVPSAFVLLDSLPLTPNGKVNRRALPAPDQTRLELAETYVAPRSEIEQTIATVWQEILQLKKVGIHDNFFNLGGHSLIATQIVSRLSDVFQVNIPLRSLFEFPTVAGLSIAVVQNQLKQGNIEDIGQFLVDIKDLSEDEIESMLTS